MICQDPRDRWPYVLRRDRYPKVPQGHPDFEKIGKPKPDATVHRLRHLTLHQEESLFDGLDRASDGVLMRRNLGSSYLQTLRWAYEGWDSGTLKRANGEVVDCVRREDGICSDASLFILDVPARHEIAEAIQNEIVVEVDELGKS